MLNKYNQDVVNFFIVNCLILVFLYLLIMQLPVLVVSAVFAYLLHPLMFLKTNFNRYLNLGLILFTLLAFSGLLLFYFVPFAVMQIGSLLHSLPDIVYSLKTSVDKLPSQFPGYIDVAQIKQLTRSMQEWLANYSSANIYGFFAFIPSILSLLLYLFLVPVLIIMFLKDSQEIKTWIISLLPKENKLILKFFHDIDLQLGVYIRGKILESSIVFVMSWLSFWALGLKYSFVLALVFAVSTFVPVVGAIIATIPVLIVSYWQWGNSDWFYFSILIHLLLLIFDANFLVPWIFATRLNLHPSVVILAVIYFGNLFGFWGVFFALPLASIVSLLLNLWRFRERAC